MIPVKIIRFLEEHASIAFAGTRDDNLVPCGHRVSGWQVDPGGRTMTALLEPFSEAQLAQTVRNHGPIAVTFEELGTHETYQFKGRCVTHRPPRPEELEIASRMRERFARALRALYADGRLPELLKASIPIPSMAVEFEVHEVFLQTPGPGAGGRIVPPPETEPPR